MNWLTESTQKAIWLTRTLSANQEKKQNSINQIRGFVKGICFGVN